MSFNWFISVDDHLIEPARLWQERLPERWRDTGPRIVRDGTAEFWVYEDRQIVTTGLNAVAGKRREEFSPEPISYDDMRLGCYDPAARVADMNQGHVLSSMLFPSFPRYCGQVFHEAKDRELGLLCVQAWNDFILEELAGAYPGRFIPMMIIPLWDPAAAADEVERTAARGAKSIAFSENPTKLGLPSIHSDHWDPLWEACQDAGFVVSMHVGSSSNLIRTSDDMPTLAFMAYSAAANQAGLRLLDIIGEDNVMLECDYPHSDSTWPDTVQLAGKWLSHLPQETQDKITVGNASRVYNFTPADPATITGD